MLAFACHPDDPDGEQGAERVIVQAKSNHGRYAPSLAAHIEGVRVPIVGDVSRLAIVGECDIGPDDLGDRKRDDHGLDCEEAILAALADGPRPSREVKNAVTAELGCSLATVKRGAKRLSDAGEMEVEESSYPRSTTWSLPVGSRPSAASEPTGHEPTGQDRAGSGISPDGEPQSAHTPDLEPTGPGEPTEPARSPFCDCRIPARSPRANGPDFCQTCKRPISDDGLDPSDESISDDISDDGLDDLSDPDFSKLHDYTPDAERPEPCAGHKRKPYRDDAGDLRCFTCGRPIPEDAS